MIYISADDYGLSRDADARIEECIDAGVLNKVSVFPNFNKVDLNRVSKGGKVRLSLHLNLVEGKCMSSAEEIPHLAERDGKFKNTFIGLLKLNVFCGKKFFDEVHREVRAQMLYWKSILPEGERFCIDGHQHTHMIPAVFDAIMKVGRDEGIKIDYIRIPKEPAAPFLKTPSLYFTYSGVNFIKQVLLNLLWRINKRKEKGITPNIFFGILLSGKMDGRVIKLLPRFTARAESTGRDLEVLFHPGYPDKAETAHESTVFSKFYLSKNRKVEFDTLMQLQK